MVGLNWLLFIWAVNIGRVLETRLGYFMTPLVNILLGAIILRERLSAWQIASILLATLAVSILASGTAIFLG
jgi:chloramphenicol-sensitive protein RarD